MQMCAVENFVQVLSMQMRAVEKFVQVLSMQMCAVENFIPVLSIAPLTICPGVEHAVTSLTILSDC